MIRARVEIGAEPDHVEPEPLGDELDIGAFDAAVERVQLGVHRPEPALRARRERGLRRDRVVVIERQRAVDPADQAGIQAVEAIERLLHAVAVAARVVAPVDDRDRRVGRAFARC